MSVLFILFLHLSNAYVQRTNALVGGESFSVTGGDRTEEDTAAGARRDNLDHAAEMARQAISFSEQAERLDLYPWAWAMLGMANVLRSERAEMVQACTPIKRAVSLRPDDAALLTLMAKVFMVAKEYDLAIASARRAVEIADKRLGGTAPADRTDTGQDAYEAHFSLGTVLYYMGHPDEAVTRLRRAIQIDMESKAGEPYSAEAHAYLAAYRRQGDVEAFQEAGPAAHGLLVRRSDVCEYDRATNEALAGNTDEALTWLGIALRARQKSAAFAREEPDFDPLRDDPRFEKLLAACPDWPGDTLGRQETTGTVPCRVI